jgi:hypothetical protein
MKKIWLVALIATLVFLLSGCVQVSTPVTCTPKCSEEATAALPFAPYTEPVVEPTPTVVYEYWYPYYVYRTKNYRTNTVTNNTVRETVIIDNPPAPPVPPAPPRVVIIQKNHVNIHNNVHPKVDVKVNNHPKVNVHVNNNGNNNGNKGNNGKGKNK